MSGHRVLRMWIRPATRAPPQERDELELVEGEGIVGDHTRGTRRHVTLLFEDDWRAAEAELGSQVDPAGRRANVYLSGGGALALVGSRLRLGAAELEIHGETHPCHVMELAAPGLRAALEPEGRAGVWGQIMRGGTVHVGDELTPDEHA